MLACSRNASDETLEGIKISNPNCHSTRLFFFFSSHLLNFSHLFELAGTQSLQLRKVELHAVKPISKSLLYQNTRNVGRCGLVTRYRVSQLRRKGVTCDSCSQCMRSRAWNQLVHQPTGSLTFGCPLVIAVCIWRKVSNPHRSSMLWSLTQASNMQLIPMFRMGRNYNLRAWEKGL